LHQEMTDHWDTASSLVQVAALVAEWGHAERVARLLGAGAGLYQRIGTAPQPYYRETFGLSEAAARARLGSEAYAAAWEAGRQLSLSQAIEEGLAALTAIEADLAPRPSSPASV